MLPSDPRISLSTIGDPDEHNIVGLFDHPMKSTPAMMNSVGIGCHPRDPDGGRQIQDHISIPQLEAEDRPPWMNKTADKVFVSKASLANATSVKIQRRSGRCIGMYIGHGDSAAETLGQWDPSRPEDTVLLWDNSDGSTLEAVTFILSLHTMPQEIQVMNAVAGKQHTNDNVFVWDDPTRVSFASLQATTLLIKTYLC